jgi:hypothetical protein
MDKTSVDVWINEHQTEIQVMSREDWLKLDESLKRPVYRKFTDEQRYRFWKDKINEVMRSFDWNELETIHLNLLLNTLSDNPKWFGDGGIENMEKDDKETFEMFYHKWDEYAQDSLGWDRALIGAIIATGDKVLNKKGEIEKIQ